MGYVDTSIPKEMVLEIIKNVKVENLIETGTYIGNTAFWAARHFDKVYTIEINPEISKSTAARPDCPQNIDFFVGDSREQLPLILDKITGRNLYWLDGHWSGGITGGADNECPLIEELNIISSDQSAIILIDDARCYLGPLPPPHKAEQWPTIDTLFALCKELYPNNFTTIIDDVIVCVPPDVKPIIFRYWTETFNYRYSYSQTESSKQNILVKILKKLKHIFQK